MSEGKDHEGGVSYFNGKRRGGKGCVCGRVKEDSGRVLCKACWKAAPQGLKDSFLYGSWRHKGRKDTARAAARALLAWAAANAAGARGDFSGMVGKGTDALTKSEKQKQLTMEGV